MLLYFLMLQEVWLVLQWGFFCLWGWYGLVFVLCFWYVGNYIFCERCCLGYIVMKFVNIGVWVFVQLFMVDVEMVEGLNYIIFWMVWYMKLFEVIFEGS